MLDSSWWMAFLKTPVWVWFVLGYMMYAGIRSCHTRVIYPPILLLVPSVLLVFKFPVFFFRAPYLYLSMLVLGGMLGIFFASKTRVSWQKYPRRLILPGSAAPLFIFLLFFCIKYTYGLLHAIDPIRAMHWAWLDVCISGLLPGYSWGKGLFFNHSFFSYGLKRSGKVQ